MKSGKRCKNIPLWQSKNIGCRRNSSGGGVWWGGRAMSVAWTDLLRAARRSSRMAGSMPLERWARTNVSPEGEVSTSSGGRSGTLENSNRMGWGQKNHGENSINLTRVCLEWHLIPWKTPQNGTGSNWTQKTRHQGDLGVFGVTGIWTGAKPWEQHLITLCCCALQHCTVATVWCKVSVHFAVNRSYYDARYLYISYWVSRWHSKIAVSTNQLGERESFLLSQYCHSAICLKSKQYIWFIMWKTNNKSMQ